MDTREVDAASIAGMTLTMPTDDQEVGDTYIDGRRPADRATYKGIAGTAFCQGSDCMVGEVAGMDQRRKFTGSWYFTPTSPMVYYSAPRQDGTAYAAETAYAQFGHWLTVTDDGAVTVHTFAVAVSVANTTEILGTNVDETLQRRCWTNRPPMRGQPQACRSTRR